MAQFSKHSTTVVEVDFIKVKICMQQDVFRFATNFALNLRLSADAI